MSVKLIPKNQKGGKFEEKNPEKQTGKSKVQEAISLAKVKKNQDGNKIEVVKKRPPLNDPKQMTNVQQFRNDSTANLKTPIMNTTKSQREDLDKSNAEIAAKEKKDKEARAFESRQLASSRKERGY